MLNSPNQNTIIEKPSSHIAEDPEEYFAAIKRNESKTAYMAYEISLFILLKSQSLFFMFFWVVDAERELKKLRGEDHTRDEVKRTDRQRRPGLTKYI